MKHVKVVAAGRMDPEIENLHRARARARARNRDRDRDRDRNRNRNRNRNRIRARNRFRTLSNQLQVLMSIRTQPGMKIGIFE